MTRVLGTVRDVAVPDSARALVLVGFVAIAGLLPPLGPGVAVAVLGSWLAIEVVSSSGRLRGAEPYRLTLGALVPVALLYAWTGFVGRDQPLGAPACAEPISMIVIRRLGETVLVLGSVVVVATRLGFRPSTLGLRRPRRPEILLGATGFLLLAGGGIAIGATVGEPMFGRLEYATPVFAIMPALVFGLMNGVMEEVVYRGVVRQGLARVIGSMPAVVIQALLFGIAHLGPDVTSPVVAIALLATGGLVAGWFADRFGSLSIPIVGHVGADVALYMGLACRAVIG